MANIVKELAILLAAAGLPCDRDIGRIRISSVSADSREVEPGCLFVALTGHAHDGHDYIAQAAAKGCAAVLSEKEIAIPFNVPLILVPDTRKVLGYIAAAFYDFPANETVLIGVTGTNGKTTSTWLLESVLKRMGYATGVIGTVNVRFPGEEIPSKLTTPEPLELQRILKEMVDREVSHVVMEVSSHALEQGRINGLDFDVALFTNLSRDHLDYHADMEDYFAVKKRLFTDYLKADGSAVICIDNHAVPAGGAGNGHGRLWGNRLADLLEDGHNCRVITYGLKGGQVYADRSEYRLEGIQAEVVTPAGDFKLESSLVGEFNLTNLLGAACCGLALGLSIAGIKEGLEGLKAVPGRLERVFHPVYEEGQEAEFTGASAEDHVPDLGTRPDREPLVFIDYAHTPDALENVLSTLKPLVEKRLIVIFGCGGDRDKGKRPLMGEVAGRLGDIVVLTSDNPRSEAPGDILRDIEKGLTGQPRVPIEKLNDRTGVYTVIQDRGKAIREAIAFSRPGDVVAICGKGHENYQIGRQGTITFDDRLEAIKALTGRRSANVVKKGDANGIKPQKRRATFLSGKVDRYQ